MLKSIREFFECPTCQLWEANARGWEHRYWQMAERYEGRRKPYADVPMSPTQECR